MSQNLSPVSLLLAKMSEDVRKATTVSKETTGLPTGLYDLDRMTLGLQPGDLVVLAGRTDMGKTALALGWAVHASLAEKQAVAVFATERSVNWCVQRLAALVARVDLQALRLSQLDEEALGRLHRVRSNGVRQACTLGPLAGGVFRMW